MAPDSYLKAFEKRLTILIGGHGSGKSEFAIMWARRLKEINRNPVVLVDLDTIKPLYRAQEASKSLEKAGIETIISSVPHSDMPAISAKMVGMFGDDGNWMVVDVGGDAIGARILASVRHNMRNRDHNLFYVINASRPFNLTVGAITKELIRIEAVSGLKVTGLISNTHMLDETTPLIIENGIAITREISKHLNIAFIGVMIEEPLADKVPIPDDLELFMIERMLIPYWLREY